MDMVMQVKHMDMAMQVEHKPQWRNSQKIDETIAIWLICHSLQSPLGFLSCCDNTFDQHPLWRWSNVTTKKLQLQTSLPAKSSQTLLFDIKIWKIENFFKEHNGLSS
jgi:hypothetical protein